MKIHQLSVFVENRPGHLVGPCRLLAEAGINIVTLALAETQQYGILRLIVRDWQQAKQVLEAGGFRVTDHRGLGGPSRRSSRRVGRGAEAHLGGRVERRVHVRFLDEGRRSSRAGIPFRGSRSGLADAARLRGQLYRHRGPVRLAGPGVSAASLIGQRHFGVHMREYKHEARASVRAVKHSLACASCLYAERKWRCPVKTVKGESSWLSN